MATPPKHRTCLVVNQVWNDCLNHVLHKEMLKKHCNKKLRCTDRFSHIFVSSQGSCFHWEWSFHKLEKARKRNPGIATTGRFHKQTAVMATLFITFVFKPEARPHGHCLQQWSWGPFGYWCHKFELRSGKQNMLFWNNIRRNKWASTLEETWTQPEGAI